MKKSLAALVAAILHGAASAGIPVVRGPAPTPQQMAELMEQFQLLAQASETMHAHARLSDTHVLLTDGNPTKAKPADCQPLKGETVAILETRTKIDGIPGIDAARVVVLEGQCKGVQGWVGLRRLEKVAQPAQ